MPEFKTAQICDTTNQTDIFPEVQMLNLNSTITNETHRKGQFFINVFGLLGCLDLWEMGPCTRNMSPQFEIDFLEPSAIPGLLFALL